MSLGLKPTHATVKAYYETLGQFGQLHIDHKMAVRSAFQDLLSKCGSKVKPRLTLVPEYRIKRARSSAYPILRASKTREEVSGVRHLVLMLHRFIC
jgi:hypothetical protein